MSLEVNYCTRIDCYSCQPCEKHGEPAEEKTTCSICWCSEYLFELNGCKHDFCGECLGSHIRDRVGNHQSGKVMCPSPNCNVEIVDAYIELLCPKYYEDYRYWKSKQAIIDSSICPTCSSVCIKRPRDLEMRCEECDVPFCYLCQSQDCLGNCEDAQIVISESDGETEEKKMAKRCPRCETWLCLETGCDSVVCTFCKVRFCWECRSTQAEISQAYYHPCINFRGYIFRNSCEDDF